VPDFAMTLQDGRTLRLSELRGKIVVLTFIYTRCPLPNFCPLMDKNFAELARWVQAVPARAEEVRLLSVSFDPEHDTPEVLAAHAQLRGAKPPVWQFAAASHDELRKVAGPLGLSYAPTGNEIIHGLTTAVIGPEGRLARLVEGNRWTPDELRRTIAELLRARDVADPAAADSPGKAANFAQSSR
jgi:protein SCO1/2